MAIAIAVLNQPEPSALTIASASRIAGNAKSTSLTRITIASTQPPKNPAATPAGVPPIRSVRRPAPAARGRSRSQRAHPRIDPAIEQIGEEVDEHEGGRDHEHRALHDGVLTLADRAQHLPPEPGQ